MPSAREKVCPKPGADHSAPFQPSPYVSVMSRVHVAPRATASGTLEEYGAPPLSVVPSKQLRLQPTSSAYDPLEQVIAEEIDGAAGGSGGDGGDGGDGGGGGGDGSGGGGGGGDGGGLDGRFRNRMIPAPPMRRRFGVFAAMAFAERVSEFTSAAARIISLTRVTERVGSSASSWAATPETCGAAMLVPLMELVAVLLEPTHAARMYWPGACAHAWRGLRAASAWRGCGRKCVAGGQMGGRPAGRWREDMHKWEGGGRYVVAGAAQRGAWERVPARGRKRRS
jgi:hypothetical protein